VRRNRRRSFRHVAREPNNDNNNNKEQQAKQHENKIKTNKPLKKQKVE
jgi:hypothetical protein